MPHEVEQQLFCLTTNQLPEEKMNTIIPNELSFDLDLNDLPTRSSMVERSVAKVIEGGRTWNCNNRNNRLCGTVYVWWGSRGNDVRNGYTDTAADARWACAQVYPNCCAGYTCRSSNPR